MGSYAANQTNMLEASKRELDRVTVQRDRYRRLLFQARAGHSEHHPSQSCAACRKLRSELDE